MVLFTVIVMIFLLDFRMKKWAEANLKGKGTVPIGKTGCALKLVHNKGFAGSRMKEKPEVVTAVHFFVLAAAGLYFLLGGYFKKGYEMTALGFAFVFGGGLSNLYDRLKRGYVIDYLILPVTKKLVFNLSDLFIFAGTILVVIDEIRKISDVR